MDQTQKIFNCQYLQKDPLEHFEIFNGMYCTYIPTLQK